MADDTPDKPEGKVEKTTSSTGTEMKGRLEGDRKRKGLPSAWGSKEEREERGVRRAEALRQQQETAYNPPEEVNFKSLLKYFSANVKESAERKLLSPLGSLGDAIYQARRLDPGEKKHAFKNMFFGMLASSVGGFGLVGNVLSNKLNNQKTFAGDPSTQAETTRQNFIAVATGFKAYDENFKKITETNKKTDEAVKRIKTTIEGMGEDYQKQFDSIDSKFTKFVEYAKDTDRQLAFIRKDIDRIDRLYIIERERGDQLQKSVGVHETGIIELGDNIGKLREGIEDTRDDFNIKLSSVDKELNEELGKFDDFRVRTERRISALEGGVENEVSTGGTSKSENGDKKSSGIGDKLKEKLKNKFKSKLPPNPLNMAKGAAATVALRALGGPFAAAAAAAYLSYQGIKAIRDANQARDEKLGIDSKTPQEEITKKREEYHRERRDKPFKEMKEERDKLKKSLEENDSIKGGEGNDLLQDGDTPQTPQKKSVWSKLFGDKKGLFGWGGLPKGKPISTEVSFERMKTEEEKSQFLQFGALPKGFEFIQGGRGRLGSAAAVAASGAVPIADYMGGVGPAGGSGGPVSGPGSVTREALGYSSGRFTNSGKDWGGVQNPTLGGPQFASSIPDHMKYRMSEGVVTPEGKRVDRSRFDDDLKKPEVRAALAARAQIEVGSQSGSQKWLESVMNRASSRGQSLMDTVNNIDGYYPQKDNRRFRELSRDQSLLPRWDKMIDTVHKDGTNLARGATGNESGDNQSSGAPIVASDDGERYVLEHRDRKWKPSFVDVDPNRKADVTKVSPEQVSASPDSSVVQIQGQVASIRRLKITDELETRLDYAAQQSGVKFEVTSGGQSHRTGIKGSFRHNVDRGTIGAADGRMYVVEDGKKRYLSIYNRDDRAQIASFTRHFTSVTEGAGVGTNYMGDNRTDRGQLFHFGGPNVKGGVAKPYLGPDWFKAAHAAGLSDKDAQKKFEKWKSERTDTEQIKDAKKFYQDNGVPIPKNIKELVKPTSRAPVQEATKVETKPVEYAQPNPDGSIPEPSAPTAAPVEKVATEPEVKAPEVKESNIEPMSAADAKAGVGEPKVDSKDIEPMSPEDTKPKQAASSSSESSGGSGGGNGGEGRQSFRNNPESKAATPGNGGYGSFGRCFVIYEWR